MCIRDSALAFTFDRRCFSAGDEQYVRGVDDAIGVINNAPTVDAVSVVRCRECLYHLPKGSVCQLSGTDITEDDFCSRGQRKEGV